ncbi:MAG: ATP-binding protein [Myxococcota bacterium]|nr:ATP-binding protein [Myxococcota bacterium]
MRISIRYQMLALMGGVLILALGTYLSLASALFTSDKLAYLFDFSGRLAGTLAEEVGSHLSSELDQLRYFGAQQAASGSGEAAASLFEADEDLLGLEVWARENGGSYRRVFDSVQTQRLEQLNYLAEDLRAAREASPIPLEKAAAQRALLINGSLPPDLALLRLAVPIQDGRRIIVADLAPFRMLRIFARPKLSDVYLVDDRGQIVVHPDPTQMLAHADWSGQQIVQRALASAVSSGVHEYQVQEDERIGAFSLVPLSRLAVLVEVEKRDALRANAELTRRSILFGVFVIAIALLASVYFSRRLTAPIRKLEETMAVISRGDFGVVVPVTSSNELGRLAEAFNRMSGELSRREALLQDANAQLIQSEKLSALGEMSAGLAHEVKNPMVGIVGFSELGEGVESVAEAREYFTLIRSDARRANEILQNLLEFARPEHVEFVALDANEVLRGAVRLVAHQVALASVKLKTRYQDGLPQVTGNANQLRQVLVNLMMNATYAMAGAPERILSVSTASAPEGGVLIEVGDTGQGMTPEVRQKIFRPFFSTKPRGQGTGLGLSVSRSIILQHHGEITVESESGQGATFRILLPPEKEDPAAEPGHKLRG